MNKKTARINWMLAFFSCLLIVTYLLPFVQVRVSYAEGMHQLSSMAMIDLYTQKEPYSGKGPNQTSDAFAPQEEVVLYANVTSNGEPQQGNIVTFEVAFMGEDPPLPLLYRTAYTNESGIATIDFRIPNLCWDYGGPEALFGIWNAFAAVEILEEKVEDMLTFKVGWIMEILSIWTINENLQPQTRFARETCVGVEMILRNIAMMPKNATITLVVYDSRSQPVANTALEDVEVEPGETSIHILCKLQIPKWAHFGYAVVYANAYTAPPHLGGVSYCPEVSTGLLITLGDVAVIGVTPSSTEVYAGEVVNITVTVRNEGRETETFNVTLYYDDVVIGTQTVFDLAPSANTTLIFKWNTTGVPEGVYVIKAEASVVPAETDTADNICIDDTVKVIYLHDVAVISVAPSLTEVNVGEGVTITVVAENEGMTTESFNITAFYDENIIGMQSVTDLAPGKNTTLNFSWDTSGVPEGNYTIKAVATTVPGEIDIGDNTKIDGTVTVKHVHDVAVVGVTPLVTEVDVGEVVNITVTAKNEGIFTESFEVTLYYDDAAVGTQTVTNLAPNAETTLNFSWDTTGVTPDVSYTIKAEASVVPGETDIGDNEYIDGTVTVKSPPVYVFPTELAILATIVASAIGLTILAILLYRRRRRKQSDEEAAKTFTTKIHRKIFSQTL